ncbi:MAG: nucleotidyl transferase AbiEii/AbiGii toxin family protein [Gammaproteobacteria bacterium]|nr:nucleotidyl transferase AbiEii/AbiGii toxin family protein [Gammaproteobacteria bacterium]
MLGSQPTTRTIEDHYHRFDYCHSLARAEKDLIVLQALDVLDAFQDDRADLAMEGGTALAYYHRQITRFSEDLVVRLILNPTLQEMSVDERIGVVKEVGASLREHIARSMPFLVPTKKAEFVGTEYSKHSSSTTSPKGGTRKWCPALKSSSSTFHCVADFNRIHSARKTCCLQWT